MKQLTTSFFVFETYDKKIINEQDVDLILTSHFINLKSMGLEEDFYFGGITKLLLEGKYKVNLFLRNYTSISPKVIEKSWKKTNTPRYVALTCLKFKDEMKIILNGFKVFVNLLLKHSSGDQFLDRVKILLAIEAISPASLDAERFSLQLVSFVKKSNAKVLFITFEGHAWERLVIQKIKNLKEKILCIGYVHTIAFPNQYASLRNYKNEFMPDLIFVSGNNTKIIFEKKISNSIPIVVLGSHKIQNKSIDLKKKLNAKILILPEGFFSESKLLINFGLELAKTFPEADIRIRLHPNMSGFKSKYMNIIKNKNNIKISEISLKQDILWSSHAIYRGSTSIIEAVLYGVIPMYYGRRDQLTIDPLFCIKNKKHYVETIPHVITSLNRWKKMKNKEEIRLKKEYINFCECLMEPLNNKVLKNINHNFNKIRRSK